MNKTSFFSDMLQAIADQGKRLLSRSPAVPGSRPSATLAALSEVLLTNRGEASGVALAKEILDRWDHCTEDERQAFMMLLCDDFGPDAQLVEKAVSNYQRSPDRQTVHQLHVAAEPRRQELLRRLNLAPNGIASLVRMREVLLKLKSKDRALKPVDDDFAHLFSSWFNRGFLVLRPINWQTPANVLEKIIKYEAVHHIGGWDELRRRLEPEDRRCFAFFHPQLADDPLIFVEVALTDRIPGSIGDVLAENRAPIETRNATCAVFYSISNCQDGLRGISFGNFLIKQVVEDLKREMPALSTFVTLSPVPGFATWLSQEKDSELTEILSLSELERLQETGRSEWVDDLNIVDSVQPVIMKAAAYYFLKAKDKNGRPIDPVARFHLGNGALLERINFLGDRSSRALRQAHGLMVNYLYKLDEIEKNHEAFIDRGEVVVSPAIRQLLPQLPQGTRFNSLISSAAAKKRRGTDTKSSKETIQ